MVRGQVSTECRFERPGFRRVSSSITFGGMGGGGVVVGGSRRDLLLPRRTPQHIYKSCIMGILPRLEVPPWSSHTRTETRLLGSSSIWQRLAAHLQLSFKVFAGKALTTFEAGLAAIFCIFPNIILVVALRAGLFLSFSMAMPGTTNFPLFFTSAVATSHKDSTTPFTSFFFNPVVVLIASYIPVAVILVDFIAGAILSESGRGGVCLRLVLPMACLSLRRVMNSCTSYGRWNKQSDFPKKQSSSLLLPTRVRRPIHQRKGVFLLLLLLLL